MRMIDGVSASVQGSTYFRTGQQCWSGFSAQTRRGDGATYECTRISTKDMETWKGIRAYRAGLNPGGGSVMSIRQRTIACHTRSPAGITGQLRLQAKAEHMPIH